MRFDEGWSELIYIRLLKNFGNAKIAPDKFFDKHRVKEVLDGTILDAPKIGF